MTALDFGHRPIVINQGMCGGCEHCPDEEREICQRCHLMTREWLPAWEFDANDNGTLTYGWSYDYQPTDWPCASAIVLGLADCEGNEL